MRKIYLLLFILIFGSIGLMAQQKNAKLIKAKNNFCISLSTFSAALEKLEAVNDNSSMTELRKAYKSAEKAWKKVQKTASKLEEIEIKESLSAYIKLVDAINRIEGDTKTDEVNKHAVATSSEISNIMSVVCEHDDK